MNERRNGEERRLGKRPDAPWLHSNIERRSSERREPHDAPRRWRDGGTAWSEYLEELAGVQEDHRETLPGGVGANYADDDSGKIVHLGKTPHDAEGAWICPFDVVIHGYGNREAAEGIRIHLARVLDNTFGD